MMRNPGPGILPKMEDPPQPRGDLSIRRPCACVWDSFSMSWRVVDALGDLLLSHLSERDARAIADALQ